MGIEGKSDEILRVWVNGCFDMGHFGHVNLLRQAKEAVIVPGKRNQLVVGVHSDAEIARHKHLPIFTEIERVEMIKSCKYVDEVVSSAPYVTTIETLKKHGCEFIVHVNDLSTSATGADTFEEIKLAGKYFEVDRTEGISTSSLIERVLKDGKDIVEKGYTAAQIKNKAKYYTDLMKKCRNGAITPNTDTSKIIFAEGSFDLYHPGHVRFLKEAKSKGSYLIVNILTAAMVQKMFRREPFMKSYERAITVMGCRYVDEVIIGGANVYANTLELYENVEFYHGSTDVQMGLSLGEAAATDSIITRILKSNEDFMSANTKNEEKDEEMAKILIEDLIDVFDEFV